ncbi:YcxB family protein [Kribbella sp. VKM Ac-2568]|uniref:YcxB family protein n=1 Tax=Kribbella sp. VKM Ac-2568 TaxID=2512219 RepID=UPI0010466882|nr:YcxB family protein [Kribbella sp. VKM Ac-2568]TCM43626.1 hypothetical protein EV648_109246 [Kribbella sp. VKM Ac-2568]
MNITIVVELTLGRRMRNVREQLHHAGLLVRLLGLAYVVWGLLAYDLTLMLIGVLFLLGPELIALIRHRVWGRTFGRVYTYTLSDDHLQVATAITTLQIAWSAVRSIREDKNDWSLRVVAGRGMTLPKDQFSPEQDAEWRAFIADRGLVRT